MQLRAEPSVTRARPRRLRLDKEVDMKSLVKREDLTWLSGGKWLFEELNQIDWLFHMHKGKRFFFFFSKSCFWTLRSCGDTWASQDWEMWLNLSYYCKCTFIFFCFRSLLFHIRPSMLLPWGESAEARREICVFLCKMSSIFLPWWMITDENPHPLLTRY